MRWLRENARLNGVREGHLAATCEDAALFLRTAAAHLGRLGGGAYDHVVMNLPGDAVSFLPHALPLCAGASPLVHCYVFSQSAAEAVQMVRGALPGCDVAVAAAHAVRSVAPRKTMFCVSFRAARAPEPDAKRHAP